jgi:hypothetical protein
MPKKKSPVRKKNPVRRIAPKPAPAIDERMKKLEDTTNKKMEQIDESFSSLKDMLSEMKEENDELRKDRRFLLDKIKTMLIEKNPKFQNIPSPPVEDPGHESTEEEEEEIEKEEEPENVKKGLRGIFSRKKLEKKEKNTKNSSEPGNDKDAKTAVNGKNNKTPEKKGTKTNEKLLESAAAKKLPEQEINAMAFADRQKRIETPLDELLELVMKRGTVKISEAAKAFRVKESQLEEWARLLEEHELIEIHYPTIGKPILKKKV